MRWSTTTCSNGHERIYIYDPFGNRLEFLRPAD